jgi:C1A family cysteine protease
VELPGVGLPSEVDLRDACPKVYDQGQLGSCTANAIAGALEYNMIQQKEKNFTPSRLFIYYNERVMEGSVNEDAGAMIRDGIKSVNAQGACPETQWPYRIARFKTKPSKSCYTNALNMKAVKYARVGTLNAMKSCLASGDPFVFGFAVYDSFEDADVTKTGQVPMPDTRSEELLGGHAVLAVGYLDNVKRFICRNSWGTKWGMKGYFTMPYDYLTDRDLSDDMWKITTVT